MADGFDVFLCYNRADKEEVIHIARLLKKAGLKPWLDEWEIPPGRSWQRALETHLKTIRTAAVFIGKSGLGPWQSFENEALIKEIVKRGLPVIPVVLSGDDPQLPIFLGGLNWVDFRKKEPDPIRRLIWGITGIKPENNVSRELGPQNGQDLKRQLEKAEKRRAELKSSDKSTRSIDKERIRLKRLIRNGVPLKAGDFLGKGRYQLVERAGVGGFAEVWKVWDLKSERFAAVKILHAQYANDQTRRQRFFRGARKMAGLKHPQIVQVYEPRVKEMFRYYFVMEWVGGGNLRQVVKNKALSGEDIIPLVISVGQALQHAHNQGLLHRDVKPSNILLDKYGRPLLTDFDLVKSQDTTGGTRTGMGSFLFTAPEVLMNGNKASPQSDLYSLAMTALFAFNGGDPPIDITRESYQYPYEKKMEERSWQVLKKGFSWKKDSRQPDISTFITALSNSAKSFSQLFFEKHHVQNYNQALAFIKAMKNLDKCPSQRKIVKELFFSLCPKTPLCYDCGCLIITDAELMKKIHLFTDQAHFRHLANNFHLYYCDLDSPFEKLCHTCYQYTYEVHASD